MLKTFQDAWITGKAEDAGLSYPADRPTKRIDYVFTRQSDRIRARKAWTVETLASDHLPVIVELEVR
jgi:endonuclease/exonuclease/phosphatase family metal-dependent hydrolase